MTLKKDFFCAGWERTAKTGCIGGSVLDEADVIGTGVETVLTNEVTQYLLSSSEISSVAEFGIEWDSDSEIVAEHIETGNFHTNIAYNDNEISNTIVVEKVLNSSKNFTLSGKTIITDATRLSPSLNKTKAEEKLQNMTTVRGKFNYLASRWATVWTENPHSRASHAAARLLTKRSIEARLKDYTWRAYFLRIVRTVQTSPLKHRLHAQYRVRKVKFP